MPSEQNSTGPTPFDRTREQLLEAMGIDVWRLRGTGTGSGSADSVPASAGAASAAPASSVPEPVSPVETGSSSVATVEAPEPDRGSQPVAATEPPDAGRRPPMPVAPFSVICLAKAGAVLLVVPSDLRSTQRFGRDILSAVTGQWGGQTRQKIYEWPQPGLENSRPSLTRSLGAFVDRQIDDHARGVVLISSEVLEQLDQTGLPDTAIVLSGFDELMRDGGLKRTLWEKISKQLAERPKPTSAPAS